jgi:hypothetical protein
MVSSVKAQANHYEALGIAPTASDDEIRQAFAARMLTARMRPDIAVARMAKLSVTYETLRDPVKRRAYDSSVGLDPPATTAIPASVAPFIGYSTLDRLNRLAAPSPPPAEPIRPRTANEAPAEPRVAGFIAASLRPSAQQREPELRRDPAPPQLAQALPQQVPPEPTSAAADHGLDFEDGRFAIGRTGATLGASVIGVAILSVALAVPAPNPDRLTEPVARAQPAVTVPLPSAAATETMVAKAEAPAATDDTASRPQAAPDPVHMAPKAPSAPSVQVDGQALAAATSALSATQSASLEGSREETTSMSTAVEAATGSETEIAPVATAARLPLPDATVARTIHRIGYACGRVISTSGVDGAAAGVFKITCSSGDSYQATPVRGRYHFRRWGSH